MSNIMIIGGHGKVAQLATPLLVEAGHRVTSVIRNPDQQRTIEKLGATAAVLDIETASHQLLKESFKGQDVIVWAAGAGGGNPARTYAVDRDAAIVSMDAATHAGVSQYIMVSYLGAFLSHGVPEDHSFFPYAQSKALADEHLMHSDLDWTILGPGTLTLEEPTQRIDRVGRQSEHQLAEGASSDTSRGNVAHAIVAAVASSTARRSVVDFVDGNTSISEVFGV